MNTPIELRLLFLIHSLMVAHKDRWPKWLESISFDNDNDDGEMIITVVDGDTPRELVISSNDIGELAPE